MDKKVISYCRSCIRNTNHKIIAEKVEHYRDDEDIDISYQIIECLGCNIISFRRSIEELYLSYMNYDGEYEAPTSIDIYPKSISGHKILHGQYHIPSLVLSIYTESLLAIQEDALILAGLGLRGVLEAICNDRNITGKTLDVRINKLSTSGFISKKDAARLHGIRFMGNDAAHEIKKPKKEQLSVALKIVEHLLLSMYILEKEATGNLDITVNDFEDFETLLNNKVKDLNSGDEYILRIILGREFRLVKDSLSELEKQLIVKINDGEYTKLSIGKVDAFNKSKEQYQYFIVA